MEVEMDVSGVHHHHPHHHHQHQQHQREEQMMSSQTLESMLVCTKAQQADKKPRPPEEALKCPRCDSSNTKFCYYNNYSLTQPRYFCKSCRRYWTKGGTLRNVPVGGGCRRNKRSSSTSNSSSATSSNSSNSSSALLTNIRRPQDHHLHHHLISNQHHHPLNMIIPSSSNSNHHHHLLQGLTDHLPYHDSTCTDLSLAFARLQSQQQANGHMGYNDQFDHHLGGGGGGNTGNNNGGGHDQLGFLDAIRGGLFENNNNPNNGFHNNVMYNNGGNGGEMGNNVGNLMGLNNGSNNNHEQEQEMMNNAMFYDHNQETMKNNTSSTTCGGTPTTAVTMTPVKQETCNNMTRSSCDPLGENVRSGGGGGGVLWGFPWQMGAGAGLDQLGTNMVHEVESGSRSQIGGWNGIGSSTNWHGLINSPLM